MAKNNNLGDFLKGIADKFRAVLGGTELINPQDFEDKIQQVNDAAHDAGYAEGYAQGGPTGITATAQDVRDGKIFGSGGNATSTGLMAEKAAATYNVSTSDQTVAANQYLAGAQTFRAVTTENISEANIKKGTVVKVGDAGSAGRIKNVTGTYSTPSSGQTAITAAQVLSGYSGFVNGGAEIKGSMANYNTSGVKTATTDTSDGNPSYRLANSRLEVAPQTGLWAHDWAKGIVIPQANLASLIGLTAAKLVSGNTILGIAGSAVNAKGTTLAWQGSGWKNEEITLVSSLPYTGTLIIGTGENHDVSGLPGGYYVKLGGTVIASNTGTAKSWNTTVACTKGQSLVVGHNASSGSSGHSVTWTVAYKTITS